MWPIEQPTATYTVDVNESLSVTFDVDFPVRPSAVHWLRDNRIGAETPLDELFGRDFTDAMITARGVGAASLRLTLDDDNRQALARAQSHSPSTPDLLREAAAAKLKEIQVQRLEAIEQVERFSDEGDAA